MANLSIGNMAIELDKIIEIPVEASIISESGCNEIRQYLKDQTLNRKGNKEPRRGYYLDINMTGEFIDWNWKTKNGTFPKRLSKYLYDKYDVVLNQEQISHIGQLARGNSTDTDMFYMDITQNLNWQAGDFGDDGSCFWASHAGAREMLIDHGSYAVRFYDKVTSETQIPYRAHIVEQNNVRYMGKARCWFVKEKIEDDKEVFVAFNGYGFTVLQTIHILSEHFGMHYRKIGLTNNGDDTGELWIGARNAENRGSGYMMGAMLDIKNIKDYDFHWDDVHEDEDDYYTCEHCENRVHEDDTQRHDGNYYCDNCFSDLFFYCDGCGEYYDRDEMHSETWNSYCDDCFAERYFVCDDCGETTNNDEATYVEDVGELCQDCFGNYSQCDHCEGYYKRDIHEVTIEGETQVLCEDCETEIRDEIESRLMDENGLEEAI